MCTARSHRTIALLLAIFLCLASPIRAKWPASSAGIRGTIECSFRSGDNTLILQDNPANWQKVDAGPFSILAPPGWEFHQLQGVDTFVGEFVGNGFTLKFDFGRDAKGCLRDYKKPTYVIAKESIGGLSARIVSPRAPSHGLTGVYFRKVNGHGALCLWGKDLTAAHQELALKIFESIRFGGPMPKYVIPPPPPPAKNPE